jgi:hypothetical protein
VPAAADAAVLHADPNQQLNHPMQTPPSPKPLAPILIRRAFAFSVLLLLGGCGTYGDFGELHPSLVRNDIHDWLSFEATEGQGTSPSKFELTDDERALRDLSYPLIEPPYDRQQWYSVLGELGIRRPDGWDAFDRTAYAKKLMTSRYNSPSARYAKITEDIRNDVTRIPQFFETAGRVIDIDQKRQKSLGYVSELSRAELDNARRRIRENALLVSLVRTKLGQRVVSYRFALDRLVVAVPSRDAVEVERSLEQLKVLIARYRSPIAPTWQREQSLAAAR